MGLGEGFCGTAVFLGPVWVKKSRTWWSMVILDVAECSCKPNAGARVDRVHIVSSLKTNQGQNSPSKAGSTVSMDNMSLFKKQMYK